MEAELEKNINKEKQRGRPQCCFGSRLRKRGEIPSTNWERRAGKVSQAGSIQNKVRGRRWGGGWGILWMPRLEKRGSGGGGEQGRETGGG